MPFRGEIRRGPGALPETVEHAGEELAEAYARGKGLLGGDPRLRPHPRPPMPPEPAPWIRVGESSPEQVTRFREFLRSRPAEFEIGSRDGRLILDRARRCPERRFVACEVRYKYARRIFERAAAAGLANLWVSDSDARLLVREAIPEESLDVVHILMPDPWWKPKHAVRRIVVAPFLCDLALRMRPGGVLRIETDVAGYPEFIDAEVAATGWFEPHDPALGKLFREDLPTRRQEWCIEHGVPIFRRYYRRRPERLCEEAGGAPAR